MSADVLLTNSMLTEGDADVLDGENWALTLKRRHGASHSDVYNILRFLQQQGQKRLELW